MAVGMEQERSTFELVIRCQPLKVNKQKSCLKFSVNSQTSFIY